MGGSLDYPGNVTEFAEWNFWVDPTAVTQVFGTSGALAQDDPSSYVPSLAQQVGAPQPTLVPLNVTETITISDTEVASWAAAGMDSELLRVLRRALKFYFEFHQSVGVGYKAQVTTYLPPWWQPGRCPTNPATSTWWASISAAMSRPQLGADRWWPIGVGLGPRSCWRQRDRRRWRSFCGWFHCSVTRWVPRMLEGKFSVRHILRKRVHLDADPHYHRHRLPTLCHPRAFARLRRAGQRGNHCAAAPGRGLHAADRYQHAPAYQVGPLRPHLGYVQPAGAARAYRRSPAPLCGSGNRGVGH